MRYFMRQTLIIIIYLIHLQVFGQDNSIGYDTKEIVKSFNSKQIDTFIVFKNYFIGGHKGITVDRGASEQAKKEKWCEISDAVYVMFKDNNKLYIQKRNECYTFKTLAIDTSIAFSYFINNFQDIRREKIYRNASDILSTGDTSFVFREHTGITEYYFSLGPTKKELTIDWFNFSEESLVDKKNIFYTLNNATKIKYLDATLTSKFYGQMYRRE